METTKRYSDSEFNFVSSCNLLKLLQIFHAHLGNLANCIGRGPADEVVLPHGRVGDFLGKPGGNELRGGGIVSLVQSANKYPI
jgi:hypothetical protein